MRPNFKNLTNIKFRIYYSYISFLVMLLVALDDELAVKFRVRYFHSLTVLPNVNETHMPSCIRYFIFISRNDTLSIISGSLLTLFVLSTCTRVSMPGHWDAIPSKSFNPSFSKTWPRFYAAGAQHVSASFLGVLGMGEHEAKHGVVYEPSSAVFAIRGDCFISSIAGPTSS